MVRALLVAVRTLLRSNKLLPYLISALLLCKARPRRLQSRRGVLDLSASERQGKVARLKHLVPAPLPSTLGGERITDDTYGRFMSVCEWDPGRAAELLERDLRWRAEYKPRELTPEAMPIACRQRAWMVLSSSASGSPQASRLGSTANIGRWRYARGRLGAVWPRARSGRDGAGQLHPPHTRPPMTQWRYTRLGMPITLLQVKHWFPERYTDHAERIRHVAYHMEHYIRRSERPRCPRQGHLAVMWPPRGRLVAVAWAPCGRTSARPQSPGRAPQRRPPPPPAQCPGE